MSKVKVSSRLGIRIFNHIADKAYHIIKQRSSRTIVQRIAIPGFVVVLQIRNIFEDLERVFPKVLREKILNFWAILDYFHIFRGSLNFPSVLKNSLSSDFPNNAVSNTTS